jgi:hypothetical protein
VIKVSVREDYGLQLTRIDRRFLPILFAPLFWPLKKPAVDEDLRARSAA